MSVGLNWQRIADRDVAGWLLTLHGATKVVIAQVGTGRDSGGAAHAFYVVELSEQPAVAGEAIGFVPGKGTCLAHGVIHGVTEIDDETAEGPRAVCRVIVEQLAAIITLGARFTEALHVRTETAVAAELADVPASAVEDPDPDAGPVVH